MRELMLELLCYEPFGKFLPEEKKYIDAILSGNYQQPPSEVHDLFSGFYDYVQRANAQSGDAQRKKFKDVDWLRIWRNTYHRKRNNTRSDTPGRAPNSFPLFFKKICFYIIVRGNFSDSEFTGILGMKSGVIQKWEISTKFRKFAEACTYSTIKSSRNGVKKPYIVSLVKKLYYEAGRQESKSFILDKLPTFVDVFAGTGSVAASVVSEGCESPIVNDYDLFMVCFAWAFTHRKNEMRKRIAEYHNYLMDLDFASTKWNYNTYAEDNDPKDLETTPEAWDDPEVLRTHMEFYGYSEDDIARDKRLAQCRKEFIIRTRSSYMAVEDALYSGDRDALRKNVDFNNIPPNSIAQISDVLYFAWLVFYYYSFEPGGPAGNYYCPAIVDISSYSSYLTRLGVKLEAIRRKALKGNKENKAIKAKELMKLRLDPSSLNLEFGGHFSRYLQKAKFYCKDFSEILQDDPSNKIFYLDSPYFLTVGYDVGFFDDHHKKMLDLLRNAKFKWVFSMQYNSSDRCKCTSSSDEEKRKSQPHTIKDYGAYYRGFYAPFQLAADQRTYYAPTDAPMEDAEDLYVLLFDFDKVKQKWPKMGNTETREMLVVNFNPFRTVPLHDSAVVYPFDLFLKCADKGMDYQDIVKWAVAWRKSNIESKYTNEAPV